MKFCIPSLTHLNMAISQKSIQLVKNIFIVKTWSKYTNELSNIVFNQMFTCFSCAGQNVASVMDTFRENCPYTILQPFLPSSVFSLIDWDGMGLAHQQQETSIQARITNDLLNGWVNAFFAANLIWLRICLLRGLVPVLAQLTTDHPGWSRSTK